MEQAARGTYQGTLLCPRPLMATQTSLLVTRSPRPSIAAQSRPGNTCHILSRQSYQSARRAPLLPLVLLRSVSQVHSQEAVPLFSRQLLRRGACQVRRSQQMPCARLRPHSPSELKEWMPTW